MIAGAAVARDEQRRARAPHARERGPREAVAALRARREHRADVAPERADDARQDRRRGDPIAVVVAEDGDPLARADRPRDPLRARLAIGHRVRGREVREARVQEAPRVVACAPPRAMEDVRDRDRQPELAREPERLRGRAARVGDRAAVRRAPPPLRARRASGPMRRRARLLLGDLFPATNRARHRTGAYTDAPDASTGTGPRSVPLRCHARSRGPRAAEPERMAGVVGSISDPGPREASRAAPRIHEAQTTASARRSARVRVTFLRFDAVEPKKRRSIHSVIGAAT